MPAGTGTAPPPPETVLAELQVLYDTGRYLDAYALCQPWTPVENWQDAESLVLAGRLVCMWGNASLSNRLHQRAFRADPANLFAAYYQGQTIWGKHGPFEALLFVRRQIPRLPQIPENPPQAYFWLLYARLLGVYRDFSAAEPIFERVLAACPADPWLWVDQADFLENQDRYPEALASSLEATRIRPWYRPAIQSQAHLLQLLERDDEAVRLLQAGLEHLQAGNLVQMLVGLLEENGRLDELPPLLDLVGQYLPLADSNDQRWLSGRRCMAAHRRGDLPVALEWARKNGSKYFSLIADKLASAKEPGRRVHLPVGFVRQHHMTCAPATLTALSNFWDVPADHAEIARQICYDGSPDHIERDWAEKSGWFVREFRPTWEVARALLDRGCPFAVVTVETDSAHMQAVIGYDSLLETLLIRDPYHRQYREWLAPNFFEAYASHGPRAMLMIPTGKASLLDGLTLPDAALYDGYYQLRRALHQHDRPAAEEALARLRQLEEGHLLTRWAAYELAAYDGRYSEALEMICRIRQQHPEDNNWRLTELRLRERLGDQVEHRKLLHATGSSRRALIELQREYAEDLARDARHHNRAGLILRSLLRRQATEPKNLRAYANLLWGRRELAEATLVYRLAACRADKTEYHWNSYFVACRHLGLAEEGLALLRNRADRWGRSSSLPARTLFDSLNALDRAEEGFAVLEEARRRLPEDGELLLFIAEAQCRHGRHDEAARLLESAKTRVGRLPWLRAAAQIGDFLGDHPTALAHWRELATLNPADTAAHSAVARLLAVTAGEAAALGHLRQACEARPRLIPLHQLLVQRLRDAPAEEALAAVDRMLALDPADAWALREKALILRRLLRLDEALACADEAVHIAPNTPSSHGVRADVLVNLGRMTEAHAGYSTGLRLSIDADWLFDQLVGVCPDFSARRAAVSFLHQQLMAQNSLEHACLQFRATARSIVSTEELTAMLREYHAANPEIWAGWSALAAHLLETGDLEQAAQVAGTATERFPLVPRAWIDLAKVHSQTGNLPAELACIQKALAINPAWGQASRQLSVAHERLMQLDQAEHVLRRAIAASPLEAINHGWLADILWRQRKPSEAVAAIETALTLKPDYSWAWDRLADWGGELGDKDRARTLARQFTESRAGEAGSWLRLVRMNFGDPDVAANLQALDRAAQLAPLDADVWDLRAQLLVEHLRYDEALAACRPTVFGDAPPYVLEGRAAWIDHRRGRTDAAIKRLQAVVERHPDYRWGWSQLTEWHWAKKAHEEVQRAAEKWAWLDPNASPPHGYLALVHQKAGRRQEAKAALARAIALDPQYGFGASELLKMHLEDSEFEESRQVLKHYATHYSAWEALRAELRLHLATKNRADALSALRRFGALPPAAAPVFNHAADLMLEAGWSAEVEQALAPLLPDPATLPVAGEIWIKARRKRDLAWSTFWHLCRLKTAPVQRPSLLGGFVAWLGEKPLKWRLRLAIMVWHRELRADQECWGQTGYALATCRMNRHTVAWMRDWNTRPQAPAPWMLSNLVLALESLGRHGQAVGVLDRAISLPADHVHEKLLGWRACEHALTGETALAIRLLEKINQAQASNYHQAILELTRALTDLQQTPTAERHDRVKGTVARLRAQIIDNPNLIPDAALRHLYRRTLDRLGRDAAKPWLRIRSRLPLFTPSVSSGSGSSTGVSWWMFFVGYVLFAGLLRSCA